VPKDRTKVTEEDIEIAERARAYVRKEIRERPADIIDITPYLHPCD
jgi:hypothetical protein